MLRTTSIVIKLAVLALVIGSCSLEAWAAWGDPDNSFGSGGYASDQVSGHYPRSVAIQRDGKILVAGYRVVATGTRMFLRRYLTNGDLDTSFGVNGSAAAYEPGLASTEHRGDSIAIYSNGKIAVGGWAGAFNAVWQFTSAGQADTTFGNGGLAVLRHYPVVNQQLATIDQGYPEVSIQQSKVLLTMRKEVQGNDRVVLVRLNSNGEPDATFGTGGEAVTNMHGSGHGSHSTIVESNGKITLGGVKYSDTHPYLRGLERRLANGQTDPAFFNSTTQTYGFRGNPGLVKTINGKYMIRGVNISGYWERLLDLFGPTGLHEDSAIATLDTGLPIEACPVIAASQSNGWVIQQWDGIMVRVNAELTDGDGKIGCSSLNILSERSRAVLQSNDRMVTAGVFNGNLMLIRTLPY